MTQQKKDSHLASSIPSRNMCVVSLNGASPIASTRSCTHNVVTYPSGRFLRYFECSGHALESQVKCFLSSPIIFYGFVIFPHREFCHGFVPTPSWSLNDSILGVQSQDLSKCDARHSAENTCRILQKILTEFCREYLPNFAENTY